MVLGLLSLPTELVFHLLQFLPPSDLCNIQTICSQLQYLSSDPLLWRPIAVHHFKNAFLTHSNSVLCSAPFTITSSTNWKNVFKECKTVVDNAALVLSLSSSTAITSTSLPTTSRLISKSLGVNSRLICPVFVSTELVDDEIFGRCLYIPHGGRLLIPHTNLILNHDEKSPLTNSTINNGNRSHTSGSLICQIAYTICFYMRVMQGGAGTFFGSCTCVLIIRRGSDGTELWGNYPGASPRLGDVSKDGRWHHIAMVFKGVLIEIYVDGLLRECQDITDASSVLDPVSNPNNRPNITNEPPNNNHNHNNNNNNINNNNSNIPLKNIGSQCDYDCVCRSASIKTSLLSCIPWRIGFGPHFSNGFRMAELCIIATPLTKEQIYFVANGLLFDPQLTTCLDS